MSKQYSCDNCGKIFGGPLDEVKFTDENGQNFTYDLCAPCRKELRLAHNKTDKDFFKKGKNK